ncbi:GNAT family N-acetyltransferase [Pedobacter yulinensis]|uniref:GNAT family N-acetyltransferase n=1 Tax=Pedobacter yulinensis TaxID=2126353 RepID=A0A2T3HJJ7_9SPHI|nr:GNAT family N-acetyltransferase [Pedobacter yulinensis]PST82610.1 GNAT family N-acetyltransferase [Pedobacter yulinensis]
MIIRPYLTTDRAACLVAFDSNVPDYFAPQERADFEQCLDQQTQFPQQQPATVYFVGKRNGKLVACGGYALDRQRNEAWLTWGMVLRSQHRQGVGSALLHHRLDAIFQACPEATVHLDTTLFSYQFFERAGFVVTGTVKDGYAPGYDRIDMICKR